MNIENINFCNERSENCVLIDTKSWERNTSQALEVHRLSGRDLPTYITRALNVNPVEEVLEDLVHKGDLLLLSRVVSEVAPYRAFSIEYEDSRYYNAPILQVVGVFEKDNISLNTLNLLPNKIIVEKVAPSYNTYIMTTNDNTFVGRVVKTGNYRVNSKWEKEPLRTKEGDVVLIRDNIETEIYLDGKRYYALDEQNVVGVFHSKPYTIEDMEVLNETVIMSEYIFKEALNSKLLTPDLVYDDLDYSDIYNRNLFQVKAVDSKLTKLNKDDILLVLRDITNYVYFNSEKYFVVSGMGFIEAKIKGE